MQAKLRSLIGLNSQGDTIVEVLIAIIIVASLMAGAYTITRTSTLAQRQAQEHTEALGLLQGQIELMRADSANVQNYVIHNQTNNISNSYFCMSQAPGNLSIFPLTAHKPPNALDINSSSDFANPGPCVLNSTAISIPVSGEEPAYYHISIYSKCDSGACDVATPSTYDPTYYLQAQWYSVTGSGQDSVQLTYRLQ